MSTSRSELELAFEELKKFKAGPKPPLLHPVIIGEEVKVGEVRYQYDNEMKVAELKYTYQDKDRVDISMISSELSNYNPKSIFLHGQAPQTVREFLLLDLDRANQTYEHLLNKDTGYADRAAQGFDEAMVVIAHELARLRSEPALTIHKDQSAVNDTKSIAAISDNGIFSFFNKITLFENVDLETFKKIMR